MVLVQTRIAPQEWNAASYVINPVSTYIYKSSLAFELSKSTRGLVKDRFQFSLFFSYSIKPKVVFLIVLYSLPRSFSHKYIIYLSHI